MAENRQDIQVEYRKLPSVDALLRRPDVIELAEQFGRASLTAVIRELLEMTRASIGMGGPAPAPEAWSDMLRTELEETAQPSLVPVINATGVIIHTNLGRAPLSARARSAVVAMTEGYGNLEYELDAGERGSRHDHSRVRLCRLTGAEDALIVNNNAGAVLLTLAGLCHGAEVLVSRGQLVEIGGGFRIPDVLRQSGATLVEVGTTNRTHVRDYRDALSAQTGAIMRIHSSNFKQIGFVTEPTVEALVRVAHESRPGDGASVLMIDDLGSGTLLDTAEYGLATEPLVQASVEAGADIVTFSGDKLLGGPQAGVILGRAEPIAALRRHPLARALRVDKMTLAALDATLLSYEQGKATEEIPVWRMISAPQEEVHTRAEAWYRAIAGVGGGANEVNIVRGESAVGGGSLPGETLPTSLLALRVVDAEAAASALRRAEVPVVCRVQREQLLFDPRTVLPDQDEALVSTVKTVLSGAIAGQA